MRKLLFQMMVSLDGYFEGPDQSIDWHRVDEEFNEYAIDLLSNVDTLVFGRITYEGMASYWPTSEAIAGDPLVAGRMNSLPKIVVSRTMDKADWENSRLVKDNVAEELRSLKAQPGEDLVVLGSSNLAASLMKDNLIDEYRIIVNPVVLGGGRSLFEGAQPQGLKLDKTRVFESGNVMLTYVPVEKA